MFTGLMILDGILSILLIGVVVMQSSKSAGLSGSIAGGAESFFGGKHKGVDELLARATIVLGVVFAVVTLALAKMSQ